MNSYTVTVISPSGNRDTFRVDAKSEGHARIMVAQQILATRPNWRTGHIVKN